MILTSDGIYEAMEDGRIVIEPFSARRMNPNSYNLCLAPELLTYDPPHGLHIDMKKDNPTRKWIIEETGFLLKPGIVYLGSTWEFTETHRLAPMLEGRSSIGRLGISIHATAGVGDVGFCGRWTLEIMVAQPVVVYPFVEICQIMYHQVSHPYTEHTYKGKYQDAAGVQSCRLFEELQSRTKSSSD